MGFPGDSPRRPPYGRPDAPQPPPGRGDAQGENWFASPAHGQGRQPAPYGRGPGSPPYGQGAEPQARRPDTEPQAHHSDTEPQARRPDAEPPTGPRSAGRPKREAWSPYEEGMRSFLPTFVAIGVVVVLVAAGIGLALFVGSGDASPATAGSPSPTATGPVFPVKPGGEFGFAESRATDPHALTLGELFGGRKVRGGSQTYQLTARRADKKCKDAVVGAGLQKALTAGKCTQLMRASFRDASGKIIGTVGVANLKTSSAAAKVVKAVSGKKLEEYLKVLPGKDSATKFLGKGEAFAGGWRHGHYAVLVWFQYKDGHLPTKSEAKKLNTAAFGVADATVTPALESRSLTGKRP
ncbi:hypothetical protein [Planomonospora venezuelensis]|uniref:Uncharacterized protein n=1 Tax=Planomonospora venezuelensis TaxID=1999 RepID=A0A841D287_PLAVE|nr:hypothetical protein [Planomonospora venezuelensis]MBB5963890.1 hypothetical protein [Planomonospora venezuelensis]GIN03699.1 hypothetical protein Pve01_53570 [Planomonospora venezuelensis]